MSESGILTCDTDDQQAVATGADRRRSRRHPLHTIGVLFPPEGLQDKSLMEVEIFDVSLHGVGFKANVPFEIGSLYHLRIGTGPLHLSSKIRIVICRMNEDAYNIGVEFI
jgi:hypothetical protein